MINDTNATARTIKPLKHIHECVLGNGLLDITLKAQTTKEKIN